MSSTMESNNSEFSSVHSKSVNSYDNALIFARANNAYIKTNLAEKKSSSFLCRNIYKSEEY